MTVAPGGSLGILGGGQLARMLALAARPLGYRVVVLDPDPHCPAAPVSDEVVAAAYDDPAGLEALAERVDAVTLEFENVPAEALALLQRRVPVRPGAQVLATARDRRREKAFLQSAGVPVAPWAPVGDEAEAAAAVGSVPFPAVLKTATLGYDGKGQARVADSAAAIAAWNDLGRPPSVLERQVELACELSVVVARTPSGESRAYAPFENRHRGGILDATVWPARVPEAIAAQALHYGERIAAALDLHGLLCVEFFVTRDGEVLANEMAPRPHNSGHLTIEAAETSQFEQALRAASDVPLGPVGQRSPAAMVNLLGDLWEGGEPDWLRTLAMPGVHLHLYGKREARPGRKMGHITALAPDAEAALGLALAAREAVTTKK